MAWIYKVVAINMGRITDLIKQYWTFEKALMKMKFMSQNHYPNDRGDTLAIIAERS